jgi:hypothetical protein
VFATVKVALVTAPLAVAVIVAPDVALVVLALPAKDKPAGKAARVTPLKVVIVIAIVSELANAVPGVNTNPAAAELYLATVVPESVSVPLDAFAGAIDVITPIASEATATADTFFNEIVFTIFLSLKSDKRRSFIWLVVLGYSLAMSDTP